MLIALVLYGCAADPVGATGAVDPHAGHDHAPATSHEDHMKKMAAMRDALRAELGAAYDEPVPGLDAADRSSGKSVYEASCMSCHGGTGHGDGPNGGALPTTPSDFSDAFHARYYSDAGRVQIIRKGHVEEGMPAFEGALTEEQIVAVYRYVRTFRGD